MPQEGGLGYYNPNTGTAALQTPVARTSESNVAKNMTVSAGGDPEYIYANLTRKQYEDLSKPIPKV